MMLLDIIKMLWANKEGFAVCNKILYNYTCHYFRKEVAFKKDLWMRLNEELFTQFTPIQ